MYFKDSGSLEGCMRIQETPLDVFKMVGLSGSKLSKTVDEVSPNH